MNLIIFCLCLLFYLHCQINQCNSESITYMNTEHPVVEWFDRRYFKNFTMLSRRVSRQDPRHYVEVYIHILVPLNNAVRMDFYFYQFLTNRYRPSFVEMHFKFCDMLNYDTIFGPAMQNALGKQKCPYPPGIYDMKNMTITYVPTGFPFNKGRIYCNMSITEGGLTRVVARGWVDMEVKRWHKLVKTRKNA